MSDWQKHPSYVPEGSRHHVIWWSTAGRHCSEPRCEVNAPKPKRAPSSKKTREEGIPGGLLDEARREGRM